MESAHRPADMSATAADLAGQTRVEDAPGPWPNIADYWPDAPHRIGPAADVQEDPGAAPTRIGWPLHVQAGLGGPPPAGPPATSRRRSWRVVRSLIWVVLTVLLLGSGAVTYQRLTARPTAARTAPTASAPPAAAASAPVFPGPAVVMPSPTPTRSSSASARQSAAPAPSTPLPAAATFELVSDVDELTVSAERLDRGVAQVGTPSGSNAVPRASMVGSVVELSVDRKEDDGSADVDVRLDSRIAWSILIRGGTKHLAVDLGDGTVKRIDLLGGATRIDLTLPRPDGVLPIRMTGGVNTWKIRTDGQAAVRALVRKGAGKVVLYGRNRGGVGRGKTVTSLGLGGGSIAIDAVGGIGQLTVSAA